MAQERAVRTRAAIVEAAGRVFDRQGYAATPVSAVVEESGVSQGAIYFHFPGKRDIGLAVIHEQVARVTEGLGNAQAKGSALAGGLATLGTYADLIRTDPVVRAGLRLTVEEPTLRPESDYSYRAWIELIEDLVTKAQEQGDIVTDLDPASGAQAIVALFTGAQLTSAILNDRKQIAADLSNAFDLLIRGITPPGRTEHWRSVVAETF